MPVPYNEILSELRMAHRVIANAEALMSPEQLRRWNAANPIGHTRVKERMQVINAMEVTLNDPLIKRNRRAPFNF